MPSPIDAPTATRSNRPRRAVKAHDQTSQNAVRKATAIAALAQRNASAAGESFSRSVKRRPRSSVTGARLDRDARAAIGMDPHWHRAFTDRPPTLGELARDGFIETSRSLSYRSQDQ
jgi:hypothetical protein